MKFRIVFMGAVFCLGALVQGQTTDQSTKSTQSANRMKQAVPGVQKSLTGCVDQQNGKYVLRDEQSSQIIALQAPGSDDDWFAKYVGHKVAASGAKDSGATMHVTQIRQVADMCGSGK